jgi:serine protease AprX
MATMSVLFALGAAMAAADGGKGSSNPFGGGEHLKAFVPGALQSAIEQDATQTFDVIVQGDKNGVSGGLVKQLTGESGAAATDGSQVKQRFTSINGIEASLTGTQILALAKRSYITSITSNDTVQAQGYSNPQAWVPASNVNVNWWSPTAASPTIAIVDSGIQANRPDFGSRVLAQVNLASLAPNTPGDGYGHGTFVAGIAADGASGYTGTTPNANLVAIDVMNDAGQSTVSDVVRACDWILANKAKYNIQVANFSLHSTSKASIMFDPLDQAVEKLWFGGVVVVAAAGNYGTGSTPSGVLFAPGNDPFVITVGALDTGNGNGAGDDSLAPWSAWGYTPDGFAKPDISAPGRYMVGPVPAGATLPASRPDKVTGYGYMQLSGTSFAAPVVAGAAAALRAQNPSWTPDQVKGALMLTAMKEPIMSRAAGVGGVDVQAARSLGSTPPNPNAPLNNYVTTASDGSRSFNATAWQAAALSNAAWDTAAWSDAAWSSAAWSSVAWSDAAWADAAWASAAWGTVAWSDVAWSDVAWSDAAWADNSIG